MRQIVLDTETTGLEPEQGHRVIEIGGVEIVDRKLTGRRFHEYINPDRDIDQGAFEVHGLSREFLTDKPRFADIAGELIAFLRDAEIIIHNAPFDVTFLNYELSLLDDAPDDIAELCRVVDSLALARHKHPGQKNNLDALCRRYEVDNSTRTLHGALLDAEILADVYLLMTGGQTALFAGTEVGMLEADPAAETVVPLSDRPALKVIEPSAEELAAHEGMLDLLDAASGGSAWRRLAAG